MPPSAPPIQRPAPGSPTPLIDGRIAHSVLCRACAYDLVGLTQDSRCPECGRPVIESLRGDLLIHASPEYLRALHRGVVLILTSLIASSLNAILGVALSARFGTFTATRPGAPPVAAASRGLNDGLPALLSVAFTCTSVWGWYLFSTPDPGIDPTHRADRARRLTRLGSIAVAASTVISATATLVVPAWKSSRFTGTGPISRFTGMGPITAPGFAVMAVLGLAGLAALALQFFPAMSYCRWLAGRMPSPSLIKRCSTTTWAVPVLYLPGMILCGLGPLLALIWFYVFLDAVRTALARIRLKADTLRAARNGAIPEDPPHGP